MAGNFFYSKVYKGGFDIKSLENARPRRYNSKIWWSIHKRRFNIVENKNRNTAAIGVFDSGVGGLTVTREIMRQLPNENVVYFGDTARVPYGSKSKNNIIRFSRQIIRFLKTKNVKAIVIACNTASALALETVKEEFDIPIIGVIVPGARAAVRETKNGQIGVLGTEATIKSETYTKEIRKLMPEAEVIGKPCPLFVPLVEEGFAKHKITEEVIDIYLSDMRKSEIDTLILGCTHYPLLRSRIMAYFGESVHIVNPAYETAMDLKQILEEQKIANTSGEPAAYDFYVSDAAGIDNRWRGVSELGNLFIDKMGLNYYRATVLVRTLLIMIKNGSSYEKLQEKVSILSFENAQIREEVQQAVRQIFENVPVFEYKGYSRAEYKRLSYQKQLKKRKNLFTIIDGGKE